MLGGVRPAVQSAVPRLNYRCFASTERCRAEASSQTVNDLGSVAVHDFRDAAQDPHVADKVGEEPADGLLAAGFLRGYCG